MAFPTKAVTLGLCGALLGLSGIWTANTGHPRYALAISLIAAATALAALAPHGPHRQPHAAPCSTSSTSHPRRRDGPAEATCQ